MEEEREGMRCRKKAVEVEAFRLTDDPDREAPVWFTQAVIDERIWIDRSISDGHIKVYGCTIQTPVGRLQARLGDYVIWEKDGTIYPCRAKTFGARYERVRT